MATDENTLDEVNSLLLLLSSSIFIIISLLEYLRSTEEKEKSKTTQS